MKGMNNIKANILHFSGVLFAVFLLFFLNVPLDSDLVTDPVHGIFTLTQVLDQFLGLQETRALLLGPQQQEVPQAVQLLQTSLVQREEKVQE